MSNGLLRKVLGRRPVESALLSTQKGIALSSAGYADSHGLSSLEQEQEADKYDARSSVYLTIQPRLYFIHKVLMLMLVWMDCKEAYHRA
jgi:hypothetical protein